MLSIHRQTYRITPLKEKTFSELGFKERTNLKAWLIHEPSALDEELLIIEQAFDVFEFSPLVLVASRDISSAVREDV